MKDVHRQFFLYSVLCLCCRFRLQSITIHCNDGWCKHICAFLSICERPAVRFVLAPIRRILWTSDQTEFVVVYFPCVVSLHAQFMMCVIGSRSQRIVICPKTFISSPYHACLHTSVPHLWYPLPLLRPVHPAQPLRSCCRSMNPVHKIHRMRSMALWPKQPLLHNMKNKYFVTSQALTWAKKTQTPKSTERAAQKEFQQTLDGPTRTKPPQTQTAQKWNVIWLFATQSCAFSQRQQQLHEHTHTQNKETHDQNPEISQAENRRAHTFLCSSFQTHEPRNNVNVNSTPHTSPFSRSQRALIMMCDITLAQVLVRVIPSMCRAPEWLSVLSSILTLPSSASFSIFHFFFLNIDFYIFLFLVAVLGARSLVHFAQWGVWPFGQ